MSEQDLQGSSTHEDTSINTTVPTPSVEETVAIDIPELEAHEIGDEPEKIEVSAHDCEMIYGAAMETAHAMLTKGAHRGIPEKRRKAQGELLATICERYNIEIPTELSVIIFGGALFADWQYMSAGDDEQTEPEPPKPKPKPEPEPEQKENKEAQI